MILAIKDLLGKTYDTMYNTEPYLALCNPSLDVICPLGAYTDLTLNAKINTISELNICVHKYTETGTLNPCYGYVERRKYIFVKDVGYFKITECSEENEGDDDIKKIITAESKETELAGVLVPDLGEDMQKSYVDANGESHSYQVTSYTLKLYDEDEHGDRSRCLISLIEAVLPGWTFVLSPHFKTRAMATSAYTFGTSDGGQDSAGDNVYNFLTEKVADVNVFDVLFLFDILNSQIYPVFREDFYDKTSLFFDRANIVESLTKAEKKDTFCTCLEMAITDELQPYLLAANPTGKYLYDFSYFMNNNDSMKWMSDALKARITEWQTAIAAAAESVDPQTLRCLEAWNTELSMREVCKTNEELYDKQYLSLKKALEGISADAQISTLDTYYTNTSLQDSLMSQIGAVEISGATKTYKNITIHEAERRIQMLRSLTHSMYVYGGSGGEELFDLGTYVNSSFNIEGISLSTDTQGSTISAYHVWTPKFRVFQNTEYAKAGVNELATGIGASFAYQKTGAFENGETYTIDLNTNPTTYTYYPFGDDSDGQNTPVTEAQTITVTGATMRLHFYHYDERQNAFFKLHIGSISGNLYQDYAPTIPPVGQRGETADITLTDAVPTTGWYYLETGNSTYTATKASVDYIRLELFINNPFLVTAFTVLDAKLWVYVLIQHLLDFSNNTLLPEKFFSEAEYAQLHRYIETLTYSNENIVVTEYDDMSAREELALRFLEKAKEQLSKTDEPILECSIDSGSEIFSDDYEAIRNELSLGSFARVELDDNEYAELPLEEITINWQECSFEMVFGSFRRQGSRWNDLISQTLSTQKAVDVKATEAYSFVKDGSLGSVKEALLSGLNTNKIRMYNSETEYELNQYGATWTSTDSDNNKYQIVISDGTVACVVTDANNISEMKTALGKFIVPGSNGQKGTIKYGVYGGAIIAETITADKIAVGAIGGWTITSDHMIHHNANNKTDGLIAPAGETVADNPIGVNTAGNIEWEMLLGTKLNFGVDKEGNLYAKDANISGTVNAGKVGGWIIDGTSIRNTDGASVNPSVFVSLISNGIIPSGQSGVSRTLIGNFYGGNRHGAVIDLPNYGQTNRTVSDTNTWQILTGTYNTFKFGVTADGRVYMRDLISTGAILNFTGQFTESQQRSVEAVTVEHLSDYVLRTMIGNFITEDSSQNVTFPDGNPGGYKYGMPSWEMLSGRNNEFKFGLDIDGNAYLSKDSQILYGYNTETDPPTPILFSLGYLIDMLAGKQNMLTWDSTPTSGSSNPVTSGGILSALNGKVNKDGNKVLSSNDFTDEYKSKLDTKVSTAWMQMNHAGSSGFSDISGLTSAEKIITPYGTYGVLHIKIVRTTTSNPYGKDSYARFLRDIPSDWQANHQHDFSVKSVEGQTFGIRIPKNSDSVYIARTDAPEGNDVPYTIYCDLPYTIS